MLLRFLYLFFLMPAFMLAQSNSNYVVPFHQKDTLFGTFINQSFNDDQSAFSFIRKGESDTLVFRYDEVEWLQSDSGLYHSVMVPPQHSACHNVFVKVLVRDCMSLYEYKQNGKTIYYLQKADNLFTPIEKGTVKKIGAKFFKENLSTSLRFSSWNFNLESVPSAVKKYNSWMHKNNQVCNYQRAFGFVGWWESAGLAVDVGGNILNHTYKGYGSAFHYGYGFESGINADAFHHLLGFKFGYSYNQSRSRNTIGTLDYYTLQDFSFTLKLKMLRHDNPFNYYYVFGGFSKVFGKYDVQTIACDNNPYSLSSSSGNGIHFGLGRSAHSTYAEISYQQVLMMTTNNNQVVSQAESAGFQTFLYSDSFLSGYIKLTLGFRISLVPLIRQYKQI